MSDIRVDQIISTLKSCLPSRAGKIGLHEPSFGRLEQEYVMDCLNSTFVSSVGKYVDEFEHQLADFTGARYAVAVSNGTSALHICLLLADVQRDDEVLMPALTFIATANAVSYIGAIPHFVDSDWTTLGVDSVKLADYLHEIATVRDNACYNRLTGRRIRALVPMHTFGHPVDLDPLMDLCQNYGITLLEDAAESLGSYYKGRHTGNWGLVSALSFNGNKIVTTGGGGAILTNHEPLARRAKHITTTAKVPHRWAYVHDEVGYNYRMPNLNAALGCAQMANLEKFLDDKRRLAKRYEAAFLDVPGVAFFTEPSFASSNYWLNAIVLDEEMAPYRDEILDRTNEMGLMTRPAWALMHTLRMYSDCPRMPLDTAEEIEHRLINIPSSVGLI